MACQRGRGSDAAEGRTSVEMPAAQRGHSRHGKARGETRRKCSGQCSNRAASTLTASSPPALPAPRLPAPAASPCMRLQGEGDRGRAVLLLGQCHGRQHRMPTAPAGPPSCKQCPGGWTCHGEDGHEGAGGVSTADLLKAHAAEGGDGAAAAGHALRTGAHDEAERPGTQAAAPGPHAASAAPSCAAHGALACSPVRRATSCASSSSLSSLSSPRCTRGTLAAERQTVHEMGRQTWGVSAGNLVWRAGGPVHALVGCHASCNLPHGWPPRHGVHYLVFLALPCQSCLLRSHRNPRHRSC